MAISSAWTNQELTPEPPPVRDVESLVEDRPITPGGAGMDYEQVYAHGGPRYQDLVAAEDADDELWPALTPHLEGRPRVVEIGAGTGRVTRLLRRGGLPTIATEPSASMLAEAIRLADAGAGADADCRFCRAEAAALPFRSGIADAAVAGWVFGHQREWRPTDWRTIVAGFLAECDRVTAGGTIIVIETLGTGHERPHPSPELAEYYDWLETEMGFGRTWIRTDYVFPTVEAAAAITGDFFGPHFAALVRRRRWSRIPECTGIWVRPATTEPARTRAR
ncbi:MAG: class I SAM-dependent methyltransferase [Actinomycetota bacterium]